MEDEIINAIMIAIPNTEVRVFETPGGWVIEAINPNFDDEGEAEHQVLNAINNGLPANQPTVIFWKIFVYPDEIQRFSVSATLHTRDSDFNENGIQTTYLEANDSYLEITEFDAEVLQLGGYNNLTILGIESMQDNGSPLLPYQQHANYLWLETLGGHYNLVAENATTLVGDGGHPARINIHLNAFIPQ